MVSTIVSGLLLLLSFGALMAKPTLEEDLKSMLGAKDAYTLRKRHWWNYKCHGQTQFPYACCGSGSYPGYKCRRGEGDCDFDTDCDKGLSCGTNNCEWDGDDDCCEHHGKRCNGRDNGCCTKKVTRMSRPCIEDDGDCDNDDECAGDLLCGTDNCKWGNGDDCCYRKNPDWRCNGIDNGCCTMHNPCGHGDGDCDDDRECRANLKCGKNNCPWGDWDDCCEWKHPEYHP